METEAVESVEPRSAVGDFSRGYGEARFEASQQTQRLYHGEIRGSAASRPLKPIARRSFLALRSSQCRRRRGSTFVDIGSRETLFSFCSCRLSLAARPAKKRSSLALVTRESKTTYLQSVPDTWVRILLWSDIRFQERQTQTRGLAQAR